MKTYAQRRRVNQAGMVSILVTMIMMLVISLIVIGFAQVSRREQREATDRQLSSQAFFAAESGINDVRYALSGLPTGADIPEKSSCGAGGIYSANPIVNAAYNVSYPCVLVTTQLNNINVSSLPAGGASTTLHIEPASGGLDKLHFAWALPSPPTTAQLSQCSSTVSATKDLPVSSAWKCPYGILRVDIVPTGTVSRAALAAGQKTMFFYPTTAGSGTVSYGAATGSTPGMQCTTSGCVGNITDISGSSTYALRLTAIYADGNVNITGFDGVNKVIFKNAQILVDATGKAQDVLRRVQVRLPLTPPSAPGFAIESGSSICKRFSISANSFSISGIASGQDQNNPTCRTTAVSPPVPKCTTFGANLFLNGSFEASAGNGPGVDPGAYFTSGIPNRGPNVFPDDSGQSGTSPGYAGGFSIMHGQQTVPSGGTVFPFLGDAAAGVAPTQYFYYSNPNQPYDKSYGTNDSTHTFRGTLWRSFALTLQPNTLYQFRAYFDNPFPPNLPYNDPMIEFLMNDGTTTTTLMESTQIIKVPRTPTTAWSQKLYKNITTDGTTKQYTFSINDESGQIVGDDFTMTGISIRPCTT